MRWPSLLLLLALALPACGRRGTRVEEGNRTGVLHVSNGSEPADLDPQTIIGAYEGDICGALFEPLVQLDVATLAPKPAGAVRWESTPDARTFIFHLRPEAKWSNGDPMRAADWVFSFRRFLTPEVGAPFASYAMDIVGAEDFFARRTRDFGTVGVRAIDPLTLEFRLRRPVPYWPVALSFFALYPVHEPTLRKFDALQRGGSAWTKPGNLVGNGPFVLKAWIPQDHIAVAANPHYWDRSNVRLQEVRFYPIDNAEAEERMFRAGQLHVTSRVPPAKLEGWRRDQPGQLLLTPINGTYYYSLNVRRPPLADARVRRALALTIDRAGICQRITRGGERPALSFTPAGIGGYPGGPKLAGGAEEARQLLAEAGFPGGRGFPPLEICFNTSETHRAVAEAIQHMWKRELGIDVTLLNRELKVHFASARAGDYQIARVTWEAVVSDPHDFLEQFRSTSTNNWTGWKSDAYDRLLAAEEQSSDNAERFRQASELEAILAQEVPVIPIYHNSHAFLVHPAVRGWPANAQNYKLFHQIRLEP